LPARSPHIPLECNCHVVGINRQCIIESQTLLVESAAREKKMLLRLKFSGIAKPADFIGFKHWAFFMKPGRQTIRTRSEDKFKNCASSIMPPYVSFLPRLVFHLRIKDARLCTQEICKQFRGINPYCALLNLYFSSSFGNASYPKHVQINRPHI
jgi:hypothetical protein